MTDLKILVYDRVCIRVYLLAVFDVCFLNSHTVCVKGNTALFRGTMPLAKNGYASHMA